MFKRDYADDCRGGWNKLFPIRFFARYVVQVERNYLAQEEDIELDDQELIRRMATRDARALEAFYDRYNRIAFTLVLRIVKVREDAEDVLTDVFWQAWQQAGRYDTSRGKPAAWLLTIARTRAIDALRSSGRRGAEP